jgi:hypothetical protein
MRGAVIHAVLLVVMLVYGYRTWTREKTNDTNTGTVVLWDKPEADLVSIEYKAPKKIVKIDRKPEGYWWGADTTIVMKPKPGTGSGSAAGSGAGSGSGSAAKAPPPPVEEEEVSRATKEFPYGEKDDKVIKDWTQARALRDLGVPNDEQKKDFKLVDAKTTLVITFKDGPKTFLIGGTVYGGSDRYAVEQATGKAYVLSKDLIANLESGESMLHLVDPRGIDLTKVDQVSIDANGKTKALVHIETDQDGTKRKAWADAETKTANTLAANFIDSVGGLRPTEYSTTAKPSDMQVVVKLSYRTDKGQPLGTLSLLKYEKPGTLPEGQELDPANPPKGETEYYVLSEKTHVPGLIRKDQGQKIENDVENVFTGKQPEGSGAGSAVNPHGNPFGGAGHGGMTPPPLGSGASNAPKPPIPNGPGSMAPAGGANPAPGLPMGGAKPPVAPAMGSAAPAPKPIPAPTHAATGSAAP